MNTPKIDFVDAPAGASGYADLCQNASAVHSPISSAMLRGGRMTKHKGEAASYSPELGVAVLPRPRAAQSSILAMGAAALRWSTAPVALLASGLILANPAAAQDQCVETPVGSDIFVCADNGPPATATQVIIGDDVEVQVEDGFEVDTTGGSGGSGGDGLNITATGGLLLRQVSGTSSITGNFDGVAARNLGSGSLSLNTSDVTGLTSRGIFAYNLGADLTVDSAGSLIAGLSGILADNRGSGALSITTADVAANGRGIDARQSANGTDVTIDSSAGSVLGRAGTAISVANQGAGAVSITTADVTSDLNDGIEVTNSGTDVTIDSSGGAVSADGYGIYILQQGSGAVSITTGDVTASRYRGISVRTGLGTDVRIDSSGGAINAATDGVFVRNNGTGAVSIVTGDVTGTSGRGIDASNLASGTDFTVDSSAGAVSGGIDGILIRNNGTGAVSIVTGDVTGTSGRGIDAINSANGTDFMLDTSAGAVTGAIDGIFVRNNGIGSLSITTGDVTGGSADGIDAINSLDGTDFTIDTTAGTVTGGVFGIIATNFGSGPLSITTADVTTTASTSSAIIARSSGSGMGLTIDTSAGTLTARSGYGISASNNAGVLSITTGDVTGLAAAIRATNLGTDLIIDTSAGALNSTAYGIDARQSGTGALTITTGDIITTALSFGRGIDARNTVDGTDITIDSSGGAVSGGYVAIRAINNGTGALSITTGDATGRLQAGIDAENSFSGTSLTIDSSAGTVTGAINGIFARNNGTGALSITTGNVTGTTGRGIDAFNSAYGTSFTIDTSAGAVSGELAGIDVENFGGGVLSITTADVTATGTLASAIIARNSGGSTGLVINTSAGAVTASDTGIIASTGSGSLSITTGDVTGMAGAGILADVLGTDLIIDTTAGSVTGGTRGISASNQGTGALSITTADVTANMGTGLAGRGIFATNTSLGTDLAIDSSAGTVTGATDGIYAGSNGSGAISVITGNVTGATRHGVWVNQSAGGTSATIDSSAGQVTGAAFGVVARTYGSGALSITTGDVTAMQGAGIAANGFGTDLIIDTTAGTVTGSTDGIFARNYGSGVLSVTTADVNGIGSSGRIGIYASAGGSGLTIDSSAGTVTGNSDGIAATQYGTGVLSITTGNVISMSGFGINAQQNSDGSDLAIDTTAGAVSGYIRGISARNFGSGVLSITTGDVSSSVNAMRSAGIYASNYGTDLIIDSSAGAVSGGYVGIYLANQGSGEVSITTGDVMGSVFAGMYARNFGTNLTIDSSAGAVSGGTYGIDAYNYGTGALSITIGDLTGSSRRGLSAFQSSNGTDFAIDTTAGTVTGASGGIFAGHYGSGTLTITTADVVGATSNGVEGLSSGNGLVIDTSAGTVTGGTLGIYGLNRIAGALSINAGDVIGATDGIFALNNGTGALSITARNVTGTAGNGIIAVNQSTGTDLVIDTSAGAVSGANYGIEANNNGTGALSITTGDVTGLARSGLSAFQSFNGTDFAIDTSAGAVTGAVFGVIAGHYGSGALTITTGDVTGQSSNGIEALNSGDGLAIDTAAGAVTGAVNGIYALNRVAGALTITTGAVTGTSGSGIRANNAPSATDLTIDSSAGAVTGAVYGILAFNDGTGALAISTGDATGLSSHGLAAFQSANGSDFIIDSNAGAVTGANFGIVAGHSGSGILSITTGDVIGMTGAGIEALNSGNGLVIDTSAGAVSGATDGIFARNSGTGALSITTGDVTGTAGRGIFASNTATGADLSIDSSAGAVSGETYGILASNDGSGVLSITTGDVTGLSSHGLAAFQSADGTDLMIDTSAGTVTGAANGRWSGILAIQNGIGPVDIRTGNVSAASGSAIAVEAGPAAAMVAIDTTAGTVAGGTDGIMVINDGVGAASIRTADVSGTGRFGIVAMNAASTTDLAINTSAGAVSAGETGILAMNSGTGALSITSADVTSASDVGIYGSVADSGTDLAIDTSAGTILAATHGIVADHRGTGTLAITAADVTGTSGFGIYARSSAQGAGLMLNSSAGTVTGAASGIMVQFDGTGSATVTTGDVIGAGASGIDVTSAGSSLTIDTTAGTIAGATTGIRAETSAGVLILTTADVVGMMEAGIEVVSAQGDASIDTTAGAVVGETDGIAATQNGTGALVIATGDVLGRTGSAIRAAAAAGTNGLTISTSGMVLGLAVGIDASNDGDAPTVITNNGMLAAESDEAIRLSGTAGARVTNNGELLGFVTLGEADDSLINNGMFLARGDSAFGAGIDILTNNDTFLGGGTAPVSLTGLESFANNGLISLADTATGSSLAISGNFIGAGNSVLEVDVDFAGEISDLLTIGGAATGSTMVSLAGIGGAPTGLFSDILVIDAGTDSSATAFVLAGGTHTFGLIDLDLTFDPVGNDFLLSSAPSQAALQFGNLAQSSRNMWMQSATAFTDQLATIRDTGGSGTSNFAGGEGGTRVWLTGYGSSFEHQRAVNTTLNGINATSTLGYDQDFVGFLAGVDFGSDAVRYGVATGYLASEVEFADQSNGVNFNALSVGAYVAADIGRFWANALVKYDSIDGSLQSTNGMLNADVGGSVFGGQIEGGALIGDRTAFFLEPSASLTFASTSLDDVATVQGSFAFEPGDSILGRAGARIGTGLKLGKTTGVVFASGQYVHEFEGEDQVVFATGPDSVPFRNLMVGDYMEIGGGIAIGNDDDAITGSVQGHVTTGNDIDGFGGSLNLRYRF